MTFPDEIIVKQWTGFFEQMGAVYCRTQLYSTWLRYGECKEPWQAIAFFLEGYAFERQGRSPSYAHAAVDSIKQNAALAGGCIDEQVERAVWKDFSERLHRRGLNAKQCPLNPDSTPWSRSLFAKLRMSGNNNLMEHLVSLLRRDVPSAHAFVGTIRGSGPKIASFMLRDVKELHNIQDIDPRHRYLLQPVDVWIWRTVNLLQGRLEFPRLSDVSEGDRRAAAQFIVSNSQDPERANMGMWYFAAYVCGSEYRHELLMASVEKASHAWEEHVRYALTELSLLKG